MCLTTDLNLMCLLGYQRGRKAATAYLTPNSLWRYTAVAAAAGKELRSPKCGIAMEAMFIPNVILRRQVIEYREAKLRILKAAGGGKAPPGY